MGSKLTEIQAANNHRKYKQKVKKKALEKFASQYW